MGGYWKIQRRDWRAELFIVFLAVVVLLGVAILAVAISK